MLCTCVAGSTSPGLTLMTLATRSTTKPSGWPRLITRARVESSFSRSSALNSERRLTIGRTRPRRLASPSSAGGAIGRRATSGTRMISCTGAIGTANISPATSKVTNWLVLAGASASASVSRVSLTAHLLHRWDWEGGRRSIALQLVGQRGDLLDRRGQLLGALALLLGGGGGLLGRLLGLLGGGADLVDADLDLADGGGDLAAGVDRLGVALLDGGDVGLHRLQVGGDGLGLFDLGDGRGHDLGQVAADQGDLVLDALDQVLDAVGVLGRVVREVADVGGHHHEALAVLAGAGGFDAAVDRQHVGLDADLGDGVDDLVDLAADQLQLLDLLRAGAGGRHAVGDAADQAVDVGLVLAHQGLDGDGLLAGRGGALLGQVGALLDLGDGGGALGGGGGLGLGALADLFERDHDLAQHVRNQSD